MATPQELQTLITKLQTNMTRFDDIINGDDTTEVTTDNAVVPSIAKAILDINNQYAANNVIAETQDNANDAEGWAITPEDVQFTDSDGTTGFSALHYAAKAAAVAAGTAITINDTTPGFLDSKLLVTAPITKTLNNAGGNETLTIAPDIATQVEAETGTATDKLMTPLRVAEAIAALAPGGGGTIPDGSVTTVKLADDAVTLAKLNLDESHTTDNDNLIYFVGREAANQAAPPALYSLFGSMARLGYCNVQENTNLSALRYVKNTEITLAQVNLDSFDKTGSVLIRLVCLTSDLGYAVGDEIILHPGVDAGSNTGCILITEPVLTTSIILKLRFASSGVQVVRKDTFATGTLTDNRWGIRYTRVYSRKQD